MMGTKEDERNDLRARLRLEQASFRSCDQLLVAAMRQLAEAQGKLEAVTEALKIWLDRAGHGSCSTRPCRNLQCAEARAAILRGTKEDKCKICGDTGREQLNFKDWRLCPACTKESREIHKSG